MEKIRESKKPQVLVVDHDDAVSLSGDSEIDTDEDEDDMAGFSPLRGSDTMTMEDQDNNSKMLPSGCYCFYVYFSHTAFILHPVANIVFTSQGKWRHQQGTFL